MMAAWRKGHVVAICDVVLQLFWGVSCPPLPPVAQQCTWRGCPGGSTTPFDVLHARNFLGIHFPVDSHLIREPHTTCVKGIMALQWLYSCVVVRVYAKGREHVHYKVCVMLRYYPCCYYTVCALISMQLLKCSLVPLNWLWLAVNIVGSCVCMYTCSWPVVEFLQSKVT